MAKTEFIKIYEELNTLTEGSRFHKAQEYLDNDGKPLTVEDVLNIPDWVFDEVRVSRDTLLAKAKANEQKAAYKNQTKKLEKEESNIVYEPIVGVSEENKKKASKEFWTNAKANKVDLDNFHTAYDEDLQEYNLLGVFNKDGNLKSKGMYGLIKQYGKDEWCLRALLKFWGIIYSTGGKAYSTKAIETAKANRTWIQIVKDEIAEELKKSPFSVWNERITSVWAYFDTDKNKLEVSCDLKNDYVYELLVDDIKNEVTDPKEVAQLVVKAMHAQKGAVYSAGW